MLYYYASCYKYYYNFNSKKNSKRFNSKIQKNFQVTKLNRMRWFNIDLLDLFFVVLLFNLFVIFSSIYNKFECKYSKNKQGEKLKIKKQTFREDE